MTPMENMLRDKQNFGILTDTEEWLLAALDAARAALDEFRLGGTAVQAAKTLAAVETERDDARAELGAVRGERDAAVADNAAMLSAVRTVKIFTPRIVPEEWSGQRDVDEIGRQAAFSCMWSEVQDAQKADHPGAALLAERDRLMVVAEAARAYRGFCKGGGRKQTGVELDQALAALAAGGAT